MKKALKGVLLGVAATLVVLAISLPFAVPPLVRSLAETKLAEMGVPAKVTMRLQYGWEKGPSIHGTVYAKTKDGPWKLHADYAVGFGLWRANVRMPETDFSETDPLLVQLLGELPVGAVSNLVFSGRIALDASAERTRQMPVPVWDVKVPIRNLAVRACVGEKTYAVDRLSVTPAVSGIASHFDIAPAFLRIDSVTADGFSLANLTAALRASRKALLVTEATADVCGGKVSLYSLFLDPKTLNTGFTLFVDDVDAGEVLHHLKGFRGEAEGRLHGKIKLFVKEGGRALRLSDAFLYSTPGETGKLQMENPELVADNLLLAGIDAATRGSISDALTDLDYSVLKLNLRRGTGQSATLTVNLDGTATRGNLSVPVNLTINFNGDLEQILNLGLGLSSQTKGPNT